MVMARLHIICGNCGSKDHLKFRIDLTGKDVSETIPKFEPAVIISCGNCGTLHNLDDTISEEA